MNSFSGQPRNVPKMVVWFVLLLASTVGAERSLLAQPGEIPGVPDALKPWKDWVLWDSGEVRSPSPFHDPKQHLRFWPSELNLEVFPDHAKWQFTVRMYDEGWIALPGEPEVWPQNVLNENDKLPVLLHDGFPSVLLNVGSHNLSGEFRWTEMPQKLAIPKSIGIVRVKLNGTEVAIPNWDAAGLLWLKRQQVEESQQNSINFKVYRLMEDGIPLWLRTEVELSVSGKNREEDLGAILPEGWLLSSMDSPIPVAVDEQGQMKVQVRPGNWTIQIDAFRSADLELFQYAAGAKPLVANELMGFRANPSFRIADMEGLQSIDVEQTTYPTVWRQYPVYQWATDSTFKLVEKMRGLGSQKPKGFTIARHFWLDDNGFGITYQDRLQGELQQSWRLDAAEAHQLGAVRIDQQRQLITSNPINGNQGVEIRSRNPTLEALGRIERNHAIPATGWLADVDSLQLTLSLPPGWRVLAVLGADQVDGDWITAWSLLDLFLVLVFALAVYRMWGIPAGLLALFAFGLSYHEPGSPRWTWLFLLMPVALLRVVGEGGGRRWLEAWRYLALGLMLLNLVPFIARQVQVLLYPQLEQVGVPYTGRSMFPMMNATYQSGAIVAESLREDARDWPSDSVAVEPAYAPKKQNQQSSNLAFDPAARTQTGPAMPEWSGNEILCRWDGPVTSGQQVNPIYITRVMNQILTLVRCVLLLLLAAFLIRMRPFFDFGRKGKRLLQTTATAVAMLWCISSGTCYGQFPDKEMLDTLRQRLLQASASFPDSANIASLEVDVQDIKLLMKLEVHAAAEVAIPLPGKLPIWSPVSVSLSDPSIESNQAESTPSIPAIVCRLDDGYLWLVVPQGVHIVQVEGNLADINEWVLAFPLPPKRVVVSAPQWQVVGLRPTGVPESQLFFTRFEKAGEDEAKYDQRIFRPIVIVERRLEIGLVWKVFSKVIRLSAPGKAIALKIPLLAGERIISSTTEQGSTIRDVNLAADQSEFTWESELDSVNELALTAASTEAYVERWVVTSSPIWNITTKGIAPIYEMTEGELMPVWQVWPGEQVVLDIRRPKAIAGQSMTVQHVVQRSSFGTRQRTTVLEIAVESSLGGDFVLELAPEAEVTSLAIANRKQPVRRNDAQLIVPLQPGLQRVEVAWQTDKAMKTSVAVDPVKLPVESANVVSTIVVPESRWVIWASGPMRGPAVRLWIFLFTAILFALLLGSNSLSPLKRYEWVLLALGLTQLHAAAGLIVVAWLFLLGWRGSTQPQSMVRWQFNLLQILIVMLTMVVLGIFLVVVGKGLLGNPEMFIVGNGSTSDFLNWFEPKAQLELPRPAIVSISIWYYRLAMLLWALWLASALLRWLQTAWQSISHGGRWLGKSLTRS